MVEAHRDGARLDRKIAVVTGGTQGIGEAIARLFAARGAAGIAICGRHIERGKAVAADLDRAGCRAEFVRADLADLDQARAVIAAADRAFGRIDILVNAAGITDRGTISDTTPDLFERMMAVNLRAPFFLIQGAAAVMRREQIEGTMVNILSMSAHGGQPFLAPYSISKGALATLTKNAAFSLMPWPHPRQRPQSRLDGHPRRRPRHAAPSRGAGRLARAGRGRAAVRPADRARRSGAAVAFLASAESGMMTGAIIDYDQSVLGCWEQAPHPSRTA